MYSGPFDPSTKSELKYCICTLYTICMCTDGRRERVKLAGARKIDKGIYNIRC